MTTISKIKMLQYKLSRTMGLAQAILNFKVSLKNLEPLYSYTAILLNLNILSSKVN